MFTQKHIDIIKNGGVGVIPTDTQYGIIASSHNKDAVNRIVDLKGVNSERKGFVNLISKLEDVEGLGVSVNDFQKTILNKVWPGPFSVVFEVDEKHKDILQFPAHALRLPNNSQILDFVSKTGPIVATSANVTSMPPAQNVEEAKVYFDDKVDFYIDGGMLEGAPSTILKVKDDSIEIVREGVGDISILE